MIKKVLIAEDHQSANISIQKTLEDLQIADVDYVYYCDDALTKIQLASKNNEPYDLLITDLYFEEDSNVQKISGGVALIAAAREVQPDIRILVFSAENKAAIIKGLYDNSNIDGFVRKARNDARELKEAIKIISLNQCYYPRHIMPLMHPGNGHEFTEYDITIISLLAQGMLQKDIPVYLEQKQIKPSGLSSMEKRLNHIKETLGFSKNEQLVAFCKDMGIL